jgi:large repetitive protein
LSKNDKLKIILVVTTILCISVLGGVSAADVGNNTTDNTTLNTTINSTGLAATDQAKFLNNKNNTGQSGYIGPQTNDTKWNYTTNKEIESSPAIGSDGTIYFGSMDGNVYALYPNGTLKWEYTTGDEIRSSPAIGSDGTIYIGSYDKNLYALNPDGTLKWKYTTGNYIDSSPAIGSDGTIYVGSWDDKLYALNPNGTLKWTYTTGKSIWYSSPAIGSDGTIYIGSQDRNLYALNPDGTLKWKYATEGGIFSSPSIGSDGTIYIGSFDDKLYALNPNGTLKWTYTTNGMIYSSASIGSDGTIYIGSQDTKLYALNPNGTLKWTYTTAGGICDSAAIDAAGNIYIASSKIVYALSPNGTLKWEYTTLGNIYGSPVIGSDGTLYIGSWDHNIYAIKQPLLANFSSNSTKGMDPFKVQFNDESTEDPISWKWDFGDGSTSKDENPTHTYTNPGIYTVTLIATNNAGSNKITKTGYITVTSKIPYVVINTPEGLYNTTLNITLTNLDFDGTATTYYTTDGSDPQNSNTRTVYTGPIIINRSTTLRYSAINSSGSWSPEYAQNYTIDMISPTVNASLTSGTYNTSQTVTLTTTDPNSSSITYYTTDATDPRTSTTRQEYTGPITINKSTTLHYAAVDPAGNWSPSYVQNYMVATADGVNQTYEPSQYTGPQTNCTNWTFNTGSNYIGNLGSPIVGTDGTIYVGGLLGTNYYLYALNPNGTVKWKYATRSAVSGTTLGPNGMIYVTTHDGSIYAFYSNGTVKWSENIGNGDQYYVIFSSAPLLSADGTLYLTSSNTINSLYAFNSSDGSIKWTYYTGNSLGSPYLGSDGTIYFTCYGYLYAVNLDGTLKWKVNDSYLNTTFYYYPVIGADGTYYGSNGNNVYAFNPDGTVKWTYTADGSVYDLILGSDGTLYFVTSMSEWKTDNEWYYISSAVFALNSNGTLKWKYATNGLVGNGVGLQISSVVLGNDGIIYAVSSDSWEDYLMALKTDGTLLWTYHLGRGINGDYLTPGPNGTLYLSSADGLLYAFKDLAPVANFTANSTVGVNSLTVQFADNSTGAASWSWDFGDGTTSTQQNPTHTYTKPGNYTVTLTVGNSAGNNTVTKTDYIVVSEDITAPVISNVTPTGGAINLPANQTITITFSEPIQAGAAYDKIKVITPSGQAKVISKTINGNTLTITTAYSYSYGDTYKLVVPVGSVIDLAGNNLTTGYNSNFTIGVTPKVVGVDPVDDGGFASTNQTITVTFSDNVTAGAAYDKIKVITPGGQAKVISKTLKGNTLTIKAVYSYTSGKYTLYIPVGAVESLSGNNMTTAYRSTFTVTSPGPTISNVSTTSLSTNKTINVTFNEPISAGANFSKIKVITSDNKAKVATVTIKGNQLIITAAYNYTPGTYTLSIPANSLTDSNGNAITENYTKTITI